jgi:hypothetical protein
MPVHVQEAGGQVFHGGESLVKMPGILDLFEQLVRNGFAGLVVEGIGFDHVGMGGPVFHDLRRKLHKVPRNRSAGQRTVGTVGEQPVQG